MLIVMLMCANSQNKYHTNITHHLLIAAIAFHSLLPSSISVCSLAFSPPVEELMNECWTISENHTITIQYKNA